MKKGRLPFWNDECTEAVKNREKSKRKVLKSRSPSDWLDYKKIWLWLQK